MIRLYVTYPDGEEREITDLYWFEEHGVHDWEGIGSYGEKYKFRLVWQPERIENDPHR